MSWTHHVRAHELLCGGSECLVKPSPKPSASTSSGVLLHMGHSLFRSCEALIQMMRFQRWPEEMGRAPCMCWPRWRRPSVTLCSTSEHSVSLTGTCRSRNPRVRHLLLMSNDDVKISTPNIKIMALLLTLVLQMVYVINDLLLMTHASFTALCF